MSYSLSHARGLDALKPSILVHPSLRSQSVAPAPPILALDLGKYKSVAGAGPRSRVGPCRRQERSADCVSRGRLRIKSPETGPLRGSALLTRGQWTGLAAIALNALHAAAVRCGVSFGLEFRIQNPDKLVPKSLSRLTFVGPCRRIVNGGFRLAQRNSIGFGHGFHA